MVVSVTALGLTVLLLVTVALTWAVDLRRVGRATSAREVRAAGGTAATHEERVRQMETRLRAERMRRERLRRDRPSPGSSRPATPPPEPAEARHRAALELGSGPVTPETLRRQYRLLVVAYHPDRVAGLGRKLQVLADEETKAINAAYAYFKQRIGT